MDFFNKVSETVTEKSKIVADKAKQVAEIASLKSQIGTCEDVVKKNYAEIGKLYFEAHKDDESPEFSKQVIAIKNAKNGIVDLEEKIKVIKGV